MIELQNYTVREILHEGLKTLVCRGARKSDGQPVILKALRQEYPAPEETARLRREFEITHGLTIAGVVRCLDLVAHGNSLVLVQEDFGGQSLKSLLPLPFDLMNFLALAIQLAETLGHLHQKSIIHKDVNPANIIVNPATGQVKLTDFGIASLLPKENLSQRSPLAGTLAYISPEQTGRMNRSLDYRTDLYSLGATLYEIVTGQLPFATGDPVELVHSHIAKTPPAPRELEARVPPALSEIIMKLLAKNAENRYQSGFGLRADLEKCRRQLQENAGHEPFALGMSDFSEHLQIPEKLYGREAEIKKLLDAFELVMRGQREIMLVTGDPGVGKSALVHEVHKSLVRERGYFIAGKFDQYQRNLPYASLIQAFQDLVRQLLTESGAQLRYWRARLQQALGVNGRVIVEVIPEIELILGEQPPVPELPPAEAQNRFKLAFQNFITALPAREHPLVLFLDDLQWADAPSLQLLQYLITASASPYFLGLGAYRDSEVGPAHPLALALAAIEKAGVALHRLVLRPLQREHVCRLLADTLNSTPEGVEALAELVTEKTAGNPFFVNQFIGSLYEEKLLTRAGAVWLWDLQRIRGRNITDNVIELMTHKLKKLRLQTQNALMQAACLGNEFELQALSLISEKPAAAAAADLREALTGGMVVQIGGDHLFLPEHTSHAQNGALASYRFVHDRVQQAAYSLLPEAEREQLHWRAGRLLLQNTPAHKRDAEIFTIANHLNLGRRLLASEAERTELAQLNLHAGRKAKLSMAYEPASNYLQAGLSLLRESDWQQQYELTLDLHVEAAEAAYLCGDYAAMERLHAEVQQRARTLLDQARVHIVKLQALLAQNKLKEVIAAALPMMRKLGLDYPDKTGKARVVLEMIKTKWALWGRDVERLGDLPPMTDPHKLAALRMSIHVGSAAYFVDSNLLPLTVFKPVRMFLRHGNAPVSPYLYTGYGIVLAGVLGDIENGYRFGKLGLQLAEKFPAPEVKCRHHFVYDCLVRHWKEPVRDTLDSYLAAYQYGLEIGDLEYAGFAILQHLLSSFLAGVELTQLEREREKYDHAINALRQETFIQVKNLCQQQILNFMGQCEDSLRLRGEVYDEDVSLAEHRKANDRYALYDYYYDRLFLDYLFEDYPRALEDAQLAEKYLDAIGTLAVTFVTFYQSLAALAHYPAAAPADRRGLLRRVRASQKKMKKWARHCAANHLHKYELVEAELARVREDERGALYYYDRAIAHAKEGLHLREEALGNELAAKFHLTRGREKIARAYLREARFLYEKWGGFAKVQQLDKKYSALLQEAIVAVKSAETATITRTTSTAAGASTLDLLSVLKASQALSGEIDLEKLLQRMIKIVIENAGAQRGFLLLESNGEWRIEAEGAADEEQARVLQSLPLEAHGRSGLSSAIIHYAGRTRESVVLGDAAREGRFVNDPYVRQHQPKSILCKPVLKQGALIALLYLENNLSANAFVPQRLEALEILSAQFAVSLENARLYHETKRLNANLEQAARALEEYSRTLEEKVEQRTAELQEKNEKLISAMARLQETQRQLLVQEKMASLGQLTAGIAHEIKNPLNFVNNFAALSVDLAHELREEIAKIVNSGAPAVDRKSLAAVEDILASLMQNAKKITEHGKRADGIVKSMMQHSRGKTGEREPADINALVDQALNLTYHGWRAQNTSFNLAIEKNYDESVGRLNVIPQDLSRVFLNIINNACFAANEKRKSSRDGFVPAIAVHTRNLGDSIEIRIRDNGNGIPAEIRDKIFNPFFTTKPAGEGTGLGLSISYDIVVQEHGGEIQVETEEGNYTEFVIRLPRAREKT